MDDLFGDDDDDDDDKPAANGTNGASSSSSSAAQPMMDLKAREAERRRKVDEAKSHEREMSSVSASHAAKLLQLSAQVTSPPQSPARGASGVHKTLRSYTGIESDAKRLRIKL